MHTEVSPDARQTNVIWTASSTCVTTASVQLNAHHRPNLLDTGTINALWLEVDQNKVSVRPTTDKLVVLLLESGTKGLAVTHDLALVCGEFCATNELD